MSNDRETLNLLQIERTRSIVEAVNDPSPWKVYDASGVLVASADCVLDACSAVSSSGTLSEIRYANRVVWTEGWDGRADRCPTALEEITGKAAA